MDFITQIFLFRDTVNAKGVSDSMSNLLITCINFLEAKSQQTYFHT